MLEVGTSYMGRKKERPPLLAALSFRKTGLHHCDWRSWFVGVTLVCQGDFDEDDGQHDERDDRHEPWCLCHDGEHSFFWTRADDGGDDESAERFTGNHAGCGEDSGVV